MSEAWEPCIGQLIDGKFQLLRYLGGSEHSGVFLTERLEGGTVQQAAIKLTPSPLDGGERQLARWGRAAKLSHRHLIQLFEMGRCELGGTALLYVVMEYADENVARVLPHRALTPGEARIVLDSVLDVLTYLHNQGFVHGHIRPANILADGEQVKVASDGILQVGENFSVPGRPSAYDPPEYVHPGPVGPRASREADVWSLGITLGETLTRDILATQTTALADAPLLPALSEPFRDIVRHCLRLRPEDRWTVNGITTRLHGRGVAPDRSRARRQLPQPDTLRQRAHRVEWSRYAIPIAAGLVLLVIVLVGTELLHRGSPSPKAPRAAIEKPTIERLPKQEAQTSETHSNELVNSDPSNRGDDSKTSPPFLAPVPAATRTEARREDKGAGKAEVASGAIVSGAVLQRVLPDVLPSARASIRGTVRVNVRVVVDSSGAVQGTTLTSPGPSKYFARLALQSAHRWRFGPPKVSGRDVRSRWTLLFAFTRSQTTVVPKQDIP